MLAQEVPRSALSGRRERLRGARHDNRGERIGRLVFFRLLDQWTRALRQGRSSNKVSELYPVRALCPNPHGNGDISGLMPARLDSVCKFICERGDWRVTNLQLQKILYMAQMLYMGRNGGARLMDARFEAWDYGPVEPNVYRKVKLFGSSPIIDIFDDARRFREDDPRRKVLEEVCSALLKLRPGQLVDVTHWPHGAWAKHYVPGVRGIPIPDPDIVSEYRDRLRTAPERQFNP